MQELQVLLAYRRKGHRIVKQSMNRLMTNGVNKNVNANVIVIDHAKYVIIQVNNRLSLHQSGTLNTISPNYYIRSTMATKSIE